MFALRKQSYIYAIITVGVSVTNIALCLLWVPEYGMIGAAYATVLSGYSRLLLVYLLAKGDLAVRFEWGRIALLVSLVAGVYLLNQVVENNFSWMWEIPVKTEMFIVYLRRR